MSSLMCCRAIGPLTIFLLISCTQSSYWHRNPPKWVRGSVTENADDIDFCDKSICISDASRMGLWMNESANPCDNFYRYVCGSLLHYQALNERYPFQGLQQILYETINEQRRKVLSASIKKTDIRPHVIAKSLYQKCVNSTYFNKFVRQEILNFMGSLGGFPMYERSAWNASKFSKSIFFAKFPQLASDFFDLGFSIRRDPGNVSLHHVVFEHSFRYVSKFIEETIPNYRTALLQFGFIDLNGIDKELADIKTFMEHLLSLLTDSEEELPVSITSLNNVLNSNVSTLYVDWRKIIESMLNLDIGENFEILLRNPKNLLETIKFLDSSDDRTFANYFYLNFLLEFDVLHSLYFITSNVQYQWGVERAQQRFEQCLKIVRQKLPVAFTSLLVGKYTNARMIEAANEVANRTMEMIISHVGKDEAIPITHRDVMVGKMRSMNLVVGYPEELLNLKNVDEVHATLNLTGHESFLELVVGAFAFPKHQKFRNLVRNDVKSLLRNESTRWIDYTMEDEYVTPLYSFDTNFIYYPTLWFQAPYFHPDRPRYYKDTMFAVFLSYSVSTGLYDYLRKHNITSKNGDRNHFDFIALIFENYTQWNLVERLDQPLPGFLLSNEQLFWFTLIHKNCIKLQAGFKDEFNGEENAEAYFKQTKIFHQSFGCDFSHLNYTDAEGQKLIQQYNKFY